MTGCYFQDSVMPFLDTFACLPDRSWYHTRRCSVEEGPCGKELREAPSSQFSSPSGTDFLLTTQGVGLKGVFTLLSLQMSPQPWWHLDFREYPGRGTQLSCIYHPDPRSYKLIDVCCFKLQDLEFFVTQQWITNTVMFEESEGGTMWLPGGGAFRE